VVGDRLALCALAKHYGEKVVYAGPTFQFDRAPARLAAAAFYQHGRGPRRQRRQTGGVCGGRGGRKWHWRMPGWRATRWWSGRRCGPIRGRRATHGSPTRGDLSQWAGIAGSTLSDGRLVRESRRGTDRISPPQLIGWRRTGAGRETAADRRWRRAWRLRGRLGRCGNCGARVPREPLEA